MIKISLRIRTSDFEQIVPNRIECFDNPVKIALIKIGNRIEYGLSKLFVEGFEEARRLFYDVVARIDHVTARIRLVSVQIAIKRFDKRRFLTVVSTLA